MITLPKPLLAPGASAVCIQRRGAVRANDSQVVESVVVPDAVDVIEDQAHPLAVPILILTAELAASILEPCSVQPFLELPPRVP
jgi:hypothetical protein